MYVKQSVKCKYDYDDKARPTTTGKRGDAEGRGEERRGSPKERERREERRRGRERVEKLEGAAEI
jgi:hypothetical protein